MDFQKIKHTGIVTIPSLFTLANIGCGFFSVLASFKGNFSQAGWLIFIAMLFDSIDGRVARLLKAETAFGVEMDSLADIISFCFAPAILIYFIALEGKMYGSAIAFMFLMFGGIRLARFNVMAQQGKGSKKHFSGLPVPAAAAVLASFAISYSIFALDSNGRIMPFMAAYLPHIFNFIAIITVVLSLLMVSTIPYAAFKDKRASTSKKMSVAKLVLLVFLLTLIFKYPQDVVFIVFSAYAVIGIIMAMVRAFQKIRE